MPEHTELELGVAVRRRGDLSALNADERRQLARWLADHDRPTTLSPADRRRRRTILVTATVAAILLIPWTAYLALTLPERHRVIDWPLTWVGLDLALAAGFAATAWFGWRRRHLVMPAMLVTATLLLCDAWFDVTLSWGGHEQVASIIAAAGIEVPLALLLLIVYRRLDRSLIRQAWHDGGLPGNPPALHLVPLQLRDERARGLPLG